MHAVADLVSRITGQPTPATRAPHPVRCRSVDGPIRWARMTRKDAARLFHRARQLEVRTRQPGRQDGRLTRNGLAVLQSLVFDVLNYATGRCDPSAATIARRAGLSVRSVYRGLKALRQAGVVEWVRRCRQTVEHGVTRLRQTSNAYVIRPVTEWRDVPPDPPPPRPHPSEWGARPPLPGPLEAAVAERAAGASPRAVAATLAGDPGNPLALALASLGRTMEERAAAITGLPA